MLVLRLGMGLGALAFLAVAALSWRAGYAPDIAFVRGLAGFAVVALLGYAGELIVATSPLPQAEQPGVGAPPALRPAAAAGDASPSSPAYQSEPAAGAAGLGDDALQAA